MKKLSENRNKDVHPISVIMPTYNQQAFIRRAILSLFNQTYREWELIIINDGSTDLIESTIAEFLADQRVRYYQNSKNEGLGVSLNRGIELARHELIAYLPSDDFYYKDHLKALAETLLAERDSVLAFSGIRHHAFYSVTSGPGQVSDSVGAIPNFSLQLVQVVHKKTAERWTERKELVTDDLHQLFWTKIIDKGMFLPTGKISCEWVDHPKQHHKIINEKYGGGICTYREYYKVEMPMKFHSSREVRIDENEIYFPFQEAADSSASGLKILLVGELAYNPERIYAFEEQGHKLYGLWMENAKYSNTVGPLPFGNVIDIPHKNWLKQLQIIQPDIIYALLNYEAVKFAHYILKNNPGIPFVWHFKEGPSYCLEYGIWNELIDLYALSDGQIYINQEARDWFLQYIPSRQDTAFILDGDLPKKDWFTSERSQLLSDQDGEIHTVLPGRPVGLSPENIAELAREQIHFHFYGVYHQAWGEWLSKSMRLAEGYVHVHPNCLPKDWVKEFSKYDAGWLHVFKSINGGELMQADWHDLNMPARMATLAAAGLPMLQFNNTGHIVSTQILSEKLGTGVIFNKFNELGLILRDKEKMEQIRKNTWENRLRFAFDEHVPALIGFFKRIIERKQNQLAGTLDSRVGK